MPCQPCPGHADAPSLATPCRLVTPLLAPPNRAARDRAPPRQPDPPSQPIASPCLAMPTGHPSPRPANSRLAMPTCQANHWSTHAMPSSPTCLASPCRAPSNTAHADFPRPIPTFLAMPLRSRTSESPTRDPASLTSLFMPVPASPFRAKPTSHAVTGHAPPCQADKPRPASPAPGRLALPCRFSSGHAMPCRLAMPRLVRSRLAKLTTRSTFTRHTSPRRLA